MTKDQRQIAIGLIKRMKYEGGTTDYSKYAKDIAKMSTAKLAGIVGILKDMGLIEKLDEYAKTSIRLTEKGNRFKNFWFYNAWQRHSVYGKLLVVILTSIIAGTIALILKCP